MNSIDVIIPCFNGAPFVERAIKSVINQSHPVKKILVINDGSTDRTSEIVGKMSLSHPKVVLVSQINKGLSAARNKGLEISDSEFVAFLDADDAWSPNKIANQLAILELHPESVGVVSLYQLTADFLTYTPGKRPSMKMNSVNLLRRQSFLPGSASSLMIKRSSLKSSITFDETLPYAEDLDFAIRLLDMGKVVMTNTTDVQIFLSRNGIQSNVRKNPNVAVASLLRILLKNKGIVSVFEENLLMVDIYWQYILTAIRLRSVKTVFSLDIRFISLETGLPLKKILVPLALSINVGVVRWLYQKFVMRIFD